MHCDFQLSTDSRLREIQKIGIEINQLVIAGEVFHESLIIKAMAKDQPLSLVRVIAARACISLASDYKNLLDRNTDLYLEKFKENPRVFLSTFFQKLEEIYKLEDKLFLPLSTHIFDGLFIISKIIGELNDPVTPETNYTKLLDEMDQLRVLTQGRMLTIQELCWLKV